METKYKKRCAILFLLAVGNLLALDVHGQKSGKQGWKHIDSIIRVGWEKEVTPGGKLPYPYINAFFQSPHMFYWDTYFINKGLLACGRVKLAKQNVMNILYIVERYGYMGNAAITAWGMNRSQPPYLSVMVRDVYERERDLSFLAYAYPLLKREYHFWTDSSKSAIEDHRTGIRGLQRFYHHGTEEQLIRLYNEVAGRLDLEKNVSDAEKVKIGGRYAAEAESGMDFTPRFGGNCQDHVAVDLNSLLYGLERNLGWMARLLKLEEGRRYESLAARRKALVNAYCWDERSGMYYDYNFRTRKKSSVAALSAFQPLWTGMASVAQAKRMVGNLSLFETPYGLATTEKVAGGEKYQWGSASVWAPLQLIAVEGMLRYGFRPEAERTGAKYLDLVAKNFSRPVSSRGSPPVDRRPGLLYEKYKTDGSINDDEYTANAMMGWTAAVFSYLYFLLYPPAD